MMKQLLAAAVLVMFSTAAFAGGKLTLRPSYHTQKDETNFMLGLSVYQPIVPGLAYASWTGGEMCQDKGDNWVKTEQGVETYYKRLTVGVGGAMNYALETKTTDPMIFGKISLTLW